MKFGPTVAVFRGDSSVMFTSYAPMGAHPAFYLGLILFAVGALLGCFVFLGTLVIAKSENAFVAPATDGAVLGTTDVAGTAYQQEAPGNPVGF